MPATPGPAGGIELDWVADLLHGLPYFARLPRSQLAELAQGAVRRSFARGETIFVEGEPSAGLWIVESGSVKAFKLAADGREHILRLFGPGDSFNDIPAFDGGPNVAGAAAVSQVTAWVITAGALADALQSHHTLALAAVQALAERVRHLVIQVEDLALRSVTARLARFLLEQVENPALASPGITRALIAAHLATTPETVSRALRALEEAGAIRFDRHRIVIVDPSQLRDLAIA
jgi:CRP/FNR family transcriptional regulator